MLIDKLRKILTIGLVAVLSCAAFGGTWVSYGEDTVKPSQSSEKLKKETAEKKFTPLLAMPAVNVPILMFHDLSPSGPSKGSTINVNEFEDVLKYLKTYGYNTITLNQLHTYLSGTEKELPENPIILTFDDGYYSNYEYAYPLLKSYNMKAVISVIGWSMGKDEMLKDAFRKNTIKTNGKIIKHFGEKEMAEMVNSGVIEIQNHTFDLHNEYGLSYGYNEPVGKGIGKLKGESLTNYDMRVSRDLIFLNETVKRMTGTKPMFIAYPYGHYEADTEGIIKKIGFAGSMTIKKGIRRYNDLSDLYEMPRIEIKKYHDLLQLKMSK